MYQIFNSLNFSSTSNSTWSGSCPLKKVFSLEMLNSGLVGLLVKLCSSKQKYSKSSYLWFPPKILITLLIICYHCCCWVASVVSDSVRPHRWPPTRLPCPRDSLGKNTGLGCHFPCQCMKVKSESEVSQSCPTLSDRMDLQPTRLLCPWDFPGKSAGVGCHCLLRCHYW